MTASPGTFKAAGLPNITGTISRGNGANVGIFYESTGALSMFQYFDYGVSAYLDTPYTFAGGISLDASRSSLIYGNSTTVQPASYTVYFIVKIK